jgi:hypothetical protein
MANSAPIKNPEKYRSQVSNTVMTLDVGHRDLAVGQIWKIVSQLAILNRRLLRIKRGHERY